MRFTFHDIKEFERKYSNYYPVDRCSCGSLKEMDISQAVFEIGDKQISVYECPVLVCKGCGKKQVGHRVISLIYSTYWDFENHLGDKSCKLTLNGNGRFEYAKNANFLYDSRDLNIPGCDVDLDPGHADGFSLPVYFDRKVLNNFYTDEEYKLDTVI